MSGKSKPETKESANGCWEFAQVVIERAKKPLVITAQGQKYIDGWDGSESGTLAILNDMGTQGWQLATIAFSPSNTKSVYAFARQVND